MNISPKAYHIIGAAIIAAPMAVQSAPVAEDGFGAWPPRCEIRIVCKLF